MQEQQETERPYQAVFADIYKLPKEKVNPFIDAPYFPIGLKSRDDKGVIIQKNLDIARGGFQKEDMKNLTENDYVWFKNNVRDYFYHNKTNEATSILILGQPSLQKTRFAKRLMSYLSHWCKSIIFEPKHFEWGLAGNLGDGTRLHPEEDISRLNVCSIIPSFVDVEWVPEKDRKKFKGRIYTENIKEYNRLEYWNTLGFPASSSSMMLSYILELSDIESIMERVIKYQGAHVFLKGKKIPNKLHDMVRKSLMGKLELLRSYNYFNSVKYPLIDIDELTKIWNTENPLTKTVYDTVSIHFFHQSKNLMGGVIGNTLSKLFYYQTWQEVKEGQMPFPLCVGFDDCGLYLEEKDMSKSLSVQQGNNAINVWRALNFNLIFIMQNPDMLNEWILESIKYIFVSRIGNVGKLAKYMDASLVWLTKHLMYEPEYNLVEYAMINPDHLSAQTFFPLGCRVGHSK